MMLLLQILHPQIADMFPHMKTILLILCSAILGGCANQMSIYRTFDISKGESPMVDIRQRAIIVAPNDSAKGGYAVCAEPSPDAMAALALEMIGKADVPAKASGQLGLAMQDGAAFTGLRTQSIQLLRDFGYRLCESHLSGALNDAQYDVLMRRFQKNTVALLAVEQLTGTVKVPPVVLTSKSKAEISDSLAALQAQRDAVGAQIATLDAAAKNAGTQPAASTGAATTPAAAGSSGAAAGTATGTSTAAVAQDGAAATDAAKLASLKANLNAIDTAIANARTSLAGGETIASVTAASAPAAAAGDVLKIAEIVGKIVGDIVNSDDGPQLCFSALGNTHTASQPLVDYCQQYFSIINDNRKTQTALVNAEIKILLSMAANTTDPAALEEIRKRLRELGDSIGDAAPTRDPGIVKGVNNSTFYSSRLEMPVARTEALPEPQKLPTATLKPSNGGTVNRKNEDRK